MSYWALHPFPKKGQPYYTKKLSLTPPSACISSIVRMTFVPSMLSSSDPTWAIAKPMYWSVIETNIGILAASIPSFKPVARRYLPRLLGEYSADRSYPGGSSGQFGKIHGGGDWSGSMPLNSISRGNEITTTIMASQREAQSVGDMSKVDSGSEKSLVSNTAKIIQSTCITQEVGPSLH
jgi:hypothetical protein